MKLTMTSAIRHGGTLLRGLALGALLAACGGSGAPQLFVLSGAVTQTTFYSQDTLDSQPATEQTVQFSSAGVPQTHTYLGTPLWGLLQQAGVQTDPAVKNDLLGKYVLATGSDGYRAVFALGELSPDFGNRASLVAWREIVGGVATPLDSEGTTRVTSPGDIKGGRYVSLLDTLLVRDSGSTLGAFGGGAVASFSVSGDVLRPASFDLAALQALPVVTRTVGSDTYTGVSLWSLLGSTAGLQLDPAAKNGQLAMYVVATGSDGYQALLSLGELDTGFGNQPDLVAYAVNGEPLGDDGFARLVVPNDIKRGRWIYNLANLQVFTAAPAVRP